MGKSVFPRCDGCIAKVPFDCEQCGGTANITIGGASVGFPLTGFTLELECNYQFLHTVNKFIYAYVFGDRVGLLTLSGFGFIGGTCDGGEEDSSMCKLFQKYRDERFSKTGAATLINLNGCLPLVSFLTGMRAEIVRPDLPIVQFLLRYHVIIQE